MRNLLTAELSLLLILYGLRWICAGRSPWRDVRTFSERAEAWERAAISVAKEIPQVVRERVPEYLDEVRKEAV